MHTSVCPCVCGGFSCPPAVLCLTFQIVVGPQCKNLFLFPFSFVSHIPPTPSLYLSFSPLSLSVCSSAPINMKVQHLNRTALVVRWTRPEFTYHPPIISFLISYSWTKHDESYEETHVTDSQNKLVRFYHTHARTHAHAHKCY